MKKKIRSIKDVRVGHTVYIVYTDGCTRPKGGWVFSALPFPVVSDKEPKTPVGCIASYIRISELREAIKGGQVDLTRSKRSAQTEARRLTGLCSPAT